MCLILKIQDAGFQKKLPKKNNISKSESQQVKNPERYQRILHAPN